MANDDKSFINSASFDVLTTKPSTSKTKRQAAGSDNSSEDSEFVPVKDSKGSVKWSKSDELNLLKGLKKQERKDNIDKLFDTVKSCLSFKPTRKQLVDKVQNLKYKFINVIKGKIVVRSGDDHSVAIFTLAQQVWGAEVNADEDLNTDVEYEDDLEDLEDLEELDDEYAFKIIYPYMNRCIESMYSGLNLGVSGCRIVKDNLKTSLTTCVPSKELEEMEKKWIGLVDEEIKHGCKRIKLMEKQLKLISQKVHFGCKSKESK